MKINLELMGPLVDFLPDSEKGKATLTLNNDSTIADLLDKLQIKRKVVVAVNGDEEKGPVSYTHLTLPTNREV